MKPHRAALGIFGPILSLWWFGCSSAVEGPKSLRLATTTSTRDSGLLDELVPIFEKESGIEVKVIAVGSGQAIELGRRGDADLLLTHSPEAEAAFVAEGHGIERRPVMYNDFVIVGPESDPAKLEGTVVSEAFRRIAAKEAAFVSRGDNSGTHTKERSLWTAIQMEPKGEWYVRAGTGMAEALRMADEKRAYALTDRATYLSHRDRLHLAILAEGDVDLRNHYSVILVNSSKHPAVNQGAARKLAEFLVSPDVQRRIAAFGRDKFGQQMFFPDAEQSTEQKE